MGPEITVGVIGDFNPSSETHLATNEALKHAANFLSISVRVEWIATPEIEGAQVDTALRRFDALWCAPGSPYKSMIGALEGIPIRARIGHTILRDLRGLPTYSGRVCSKCPGNRRGGTRRDSTRSACSCGVPPCLLVGWGN